MNAKDIGIMAMIAGVGAAAMVDNLRRHAHRTTATQSAPGSKYYRKQRNKKNRAAKASRKKNRG